MIQDPAAQSIGQISADGQFRWDGQQWVPLAAGYREPTTWTRPMQLISSGLLAVSAVVSVISTFIFVNHESMLRALKAQNIQLQSGTTLDDVANISLGVTYAIVIVFALLDVVAAVGSYLGWRWMFWAAMVLFGLSAIGAFTNISAFADPSKSPVPIGGLILSELFALASLAMFVWMLIGAIKFGPWAMRKPSA